MEPGRFSTFQLSVLVLWLTDSDDYNCCGCVEEAVTYCRREIPHLFRSGTRRVSICQTKMKISTLTSITSVTENESANMPTWTLSRILERSLIYTILVRLVPLHFKSWMKMTPFYDTLSHHPRWFRSMSAAVCPLLLVARRRVSKIGAPTHEER